MPLLAVVRGRLFKGAFSFSLSALEDCRDWWSLSDSRSSTASALPLSRVIRTRLFVGSFSFARSALSAALSAFFAALRMSRSESSSSVKWRRRALSAIVHLPLPDLRQLGRHDLVEFQVGGETVHEGQDDIAEKQQPCVSSVTAAGPRPWRNGCRISSISPGSPPMLRQDGAVPRRLVEHDDEVAVLKDVLHFPAGEQVLHINLCHRLPEHLQPPHQCGHHQPHRLL